LGAKLKKPIKAAEALPELMSGSSGNIYINNNLTPRTKKLLGMTKQAALLPYFGFVGPDGMKIVAREQNT